MGLGPPVCLDCMKIMIMQSVPFVSGLCYQWICPCGNISDNGARVKYLFCLSAEQAKIVEENSKGEQP